MILKDWLVKITVSHSSDPEPGLTDSVSDSLDAADTGGGLTAGWPLVRENSSRSGKSQGILQIDQGNFKHQESQGKVREFHNFGPKYML